MEIPLEVTFRGLDRSSFIEENIRKQVDRLERFHPRITHCHVTVEQAHHHHHKGNIFDVRVDLLIPGTELVVGGEKAHDHSHEDVYVAIRDAFHAVTRRLEDTVRRIRSERRSGEEV